MEMNTLELWFGLGRAEKALSTCICYSWVPLSETKASDQSGL